MSRTKIPHYTKQYGIFYKYIGSEDTTNSLYINQIQVSVLLKVKTP